MNKGSYFPNGTTHEDEYYYLGELNFVWDKAKNEHNLKNHGVDFRTAALVFNDPDALVDNDFEHSDGEWRSSETGIPIDFNDVLDIPGFEGIPRAVVGAIDNVLFVVYTVRYIKGSDYFRIISARRANDREKKAYEEVKYHM